MLLAIEIGLTGLGLGSLRIDIGSNAGTAVSVGVWVWGEARRSEASNGRARGGSQRRTGRAQQALGAPIESALRAHSGAKNTPESLAGGRRARPANQYTAAPQPLSAFLAGSTPRHAGSGACAAAKHKRAGDVLAHVLVLGAGRRLCLTAADDDSEFLSLLAGCSTSTQYPTIHSPRNVYSAAPPKRKGGDLIRVVTL
jgi:hypothetical protein